MCDKENYNESRCSSLVGTEEYIAPEVIKGQEVSYSTDLWSLGIILYQFLVGSTPFKGSSQSLTFDNILNGGQLTFSNSTVPPEA